MSLNHKIKFRDGIEWWDNLGQTDKKYPFQMMVGAILCLGANAVLTKLANDLPTLMYGGIRATFIGLLFLITVLIQKGSINPRNIRGLMITATLEVGFFLFWFSGLQSAPAINSSLIYLLFPVFIYFGSVIFLKEPRQTRVIVGSLIALIGGILFFGSPAISGSGIDILFGNGSILIGYMFLAAYVIYTKKLYDDYTPNEIIAFNFSVAGIVLVCLSFAHYGVEAINISARTGLVLLCAVTLSGYIALRVLYNALRYVRAEDTAPLFYLDPLSGSFLSVLLLHETVSPLAFAAACIIIFGVLIGHPVHVRRLHYLHQPTRHRFEEFVQKLRQLATSGEDRLKRLF